MDNETSHVVAMLDPWFYRHANEYVLEERNWDMYLEPLMQEADFILDNLMDALECYHDSNIELCMELPVRVFSLHVFKLFWSLRIHEPLWICPAYVEPRRLPRTINISEFSCRFPKYDLPCCHSDDYARRLEVL